MNRTFALATVLAASLSTATLTAQAPAAAATATPPANPQALPAKIAIIEFEQVVLSTNEAQKAMADINSKYAPQQKRIQDTQTELESLKKQLQALPPTTTDDERANRLKVIDAKEKQLNLDIETASGSYQDEERKAIGPIYNKVGQTALKYAQDSGFTLLLDGTPQQQGPMTVIWWNQTTDISQAVVNAYNTASGVAAPPSAPNAAPKRPTPAAPAAAPKK